MGWDLGMKLPWLIGAFFDNVATDLGHQRLHQAGLVGHKARRSRIKQVTLRGATQTISGGSYVIASQAKIDAAVHRASWRPHRERKLRVAAMSATETSADRRLHHGQRPLWQAWG